MVCIYLTLVMSCLVVQCYQLCYVGKAGQAAGGNEETANQAS